MKDFQAYIPTRICFGPSQEKSFFSELAKLSKQLLVVTGGGSVKKFGYLDRVLSAIEASGIQFTVFEGIEPNPLAKTINRAAQENAGKGIDAVLAVGGGSVMDAAKAISALLHDNENDVWPFVTANEKVGQFRGALPLACIPTTAATASEVTPFAVISHDSPKGKSTLAYEFLKPKLAWLNPEFTASLPPTPTRDGASDIISHLIENYLIGGNESPVADRYTEGLIKTVMETLPAVLQNPADLHLRGVLLWCSTLALNGLQVAGRNPTPFPLHSIEHSMSAVNHGLAHGRGLATLYPAYFRWLRTNERATDRMALLGRNLFGIQGEQEACCVQFIERFEGWLRDNSLLQSAEDVGIPASAFEEVAHYAVTTYGQNGALPVLGRLDQAGIIEILSLTARQGSAT